MAIIVTTALVMGVSIATGPSAVVALIGVGFLVISNGLESKSPNHGVMVYVNKVEKYQAGQVFTSYTYTIGKVGTY